MATIQNSTSSCPPNRLYFHFPLFSWSTIFGRCGRGAVVFGVSFVSVSQRCRSQTFESSVQVQVQALASWPAQACLGNSGEVRLLAAGVSVLSLALLFLRPRLPRRFSRSCCSSGLWPRPQCAESPEQAPTSMSDQLARRVRALFDISSSMSPIPSTSW